MQIHSNVLQFYIAIEILKFEHLRRKNTREYARALPLKNGKFQLFSLVENKAKFMGK